MPENGETKFKGKLKKDKLYDLCIELPIWYEKDMEYPSVSMACRVIDTDTRTVIIDDYLAESIRKGEKVSRADLINYSVQIWANKFDKLGLRHVIIQNDHTPNSGIYEWSYGYDPDFLGYMKGVLKLEEFILAEGGII